MLNRDQCCFIRADYSVGSGYRITNSLVLTAAHVVRRRRQIDVTVAPGETGEHRSSATCVWERLAVGIDVAVIEMTKPPTGAVSAITFGTVRDEASVIDAIALGYPRWKL